MKLKIIFIALGLLTVSAIECSRPQRSAVDISPYIPLINSRSVEKLAQVLYELPEKLLQPTLSYILEDRQSVLKRNDKCELIFALILLNSKDKAAQKNLFNYLQRPELAQGMPLLFVAAHGIYSDLISPLIRWTHEISAEQANAMVKDAYEYAINRGALKEFQRLYTHGAFISPVLATQLLWKVIDLNKHARFAKILIKAGAEVNAIHGKWTPLTRAVSYGNYAMVQVLLDARAQVNQIPTAETGSPLQIALRLKNSAIELLLRKHGAHE